MFLFQTGSIKRRRRSGPLPRYDEGFYSRLVRLKAVFSFTKSPPMYRFYSRLVRLKVQYAWSASRGTFVFLFQTGSIKSCINTGTGRLKHVSIPDWFD